ncbi:MAG TPA: TIGR04282 family arsenosugar biosynthesis glycosyltransferase [Cyclobacteriaceae bacterium]|nr:TIGR04282 family arsenosugar biosynthesis glycosyltransferase [Cyclobacteriaceae bacterium]HNP07860.1 TIGR04282 family arsenosugar biosynthesis glycosyltransferase [Cyclobacteriaceae bacterium]
MQKRLLIIFYRNPELGKVKTRLAATLGDGNALAVYLKLVNHTQSITKDLAVDKMVCYSHHVDTEDSWCNEEYHKEIQKGTTLGEKLEHAVKQAFEKDYQSVGVIGSDCFELTEEILNQSFQKLESKDAVIGPAKDGGYYLLGMRRFIPDLFKNKEWSTSTVAKDTINDFKRLKLDYFELPTLRDVDREEDLPEELRVKLR